jgi:hypothetical protein
VWRAYATVVHADVVGLDGTDMVSAMTTVLYYHRIAVFERAAQQREFIFILSLHHKHAL